MNEFLKFEGLLSHLGPGSTIVKFQADMTKKPKYLNICEVFR